MISMRCLIEVELLLDWYAPHRAGAQLSSGAKATFVSLWRKILTEGVTAQPTWTLRDYHSPNLIWLPQREGVANDRHASISRIACSAILPMTSSRCCRTRG